MVEKKEKIVRLFWQKLVQKYFDFCRENFGMKPSFDGSAPRDFARLYDELKIRVEEEGIEWDYENAEQSLLLFLTTANEDKWLHENFMLFNLNRHKDKIFFKMKTLSKRNGTEIVRNFGKKPIPKINPEGGFGEL